VTNRNIYDVPTVIESEIQEVDKHEDEDDECVGGYAPVQQVNDEDSTQLRRDDLEPIAVDEVYVKLDGSMFIITSDDEDELSSNDDTNSAHENELSCNSYTDSDDDMC